VCIEEDFRKGRNSNHSEIGTGGELVVDYKHIDRDINVEKTEVWLYCAGCRKQQLKRAWKYSAQISLWSCFIVIDAYGLLALD
jgi:hypothetical protein